MEEEYILNSTFELVPTGAEVYELRSPMFGGRLEATAYQIGVLQQFEAGARPDDILKQYPFDKESTIAFLERCIDEGFLLPRLPSGKPRLPDRVLPQPSMFAAPRHDKTDPAAFTVLGIPLDTNTTGAPGARFGPAAIRTASEGIRYGLDAQTLAPRGFLDFGTGRKLLEGVTLADAGDVYLATGEDPPDAYDRITQVVHDLLETGTIPLILGGDHSITYPVLRAFPHERLGIVHLDAHTDLGDIAPVGLHHGNVFSVVLEKLEFVERVYQFGLRGIIEGGVDHGHARATWFGMDVLRTRGVDALLAELPADVPYYVSVDIDVLDPSFAPSTGTPVPYGMFPHEMKAILRGVAESRDVVGMDVVEVGQPLSNADATAPLAVEAFLTLADGLVRRLTESA